MRKSPLILLILLGSVITNAQVRNGYTNYAIYDENRNLLAADSVDTNRDFHISPAAGLSNGDFDKLYTMWRCFYGDPYGLFVQLYAVYNNPAFVNTLASSKITWSGLPTQYIKGDGGYGTLSLVATTGSFSDLTGTSNVLLSTGSYSNPSWITSLDRSKISYSGSTTQYVRGDGSLATFPSIPAGQVNSDWNSSSGLSQILNKPTIPTTTSQLTNNSGWIAKTDLSNGIGISYNNSTGIISSSDYWNTANTTSGSVTFYLTSDKTSSGTAIYSTIDYVNPIINNASVNYTYGWSYNSGTKALTVTAKYNPVVVILSTSVIGALSNVSDGTPVQVTVKGH